MKAPSPSHRFRGSAPRPFGANQGTCEWQLNVAASRSEGRAVPCSTVGKGMGVKGFNPCNSLRPAQQPEPLRDS